MRVRWRHRWNLTPAEARRLQQRGVARLDRATRLDLDRFARKGTLAAVDVSYERRLDRCFAALILWDVAAGRSLGEWTAESPSLFPYVPGLLSFREIPALIPLFRALRTPPDLILCDGQGQAHPLRFGLAAHIGVTYGMPSLGWAKSRLIGEFARLSVRRGAATPLLHKDEQIGWAYRSRAHCRETYVSPGHQLSMDDSLALARLLSGSHRLCEPARAAHHHTRLAQQAALRAAGF